MLGSLVGAGASIFGGILGRNSDRKAQEAANIYNDPAQMRSRAEAAGFNPLVYMNSGTAQQVTTRGSQAFGNGIANAGLALQSGFSEKKQLDLQRTKLDQDQKRLDILLEQATIRPKVGGLYSGNQVTSANAPRVGAGVAAAASAPVFPASTPFEPESGSGGVDYAGNPVTGISTPFGPIQTDARSSDAENAETRYGDIFQEVVGISNLALDAYKTTRHWYDKSDWKKRSDAHKQREADAYKKRDDLKAAQRAARPSAADRKKHMAQFTNPLLSY